LRRRGVGAAQGERRRCRQVAGSRKPTTPPCANSSSRFEPPARAGGSPTLRPRLIEPRESRRARPAELRSRRSRPRARRSRGSP